MMHCWMRGKPPMSANASKKAEPKGQNANEVTTTGDTAGMEYSVRKPRPYWQDPPKVIETNGG